MHAVKVGGIFILLLLYAYWMWPKQDTIYTIPNNLQRYILYDELPVSAVVDVNTLKRKIKEMNGEREVRNWMKHGPVGKETVIVAVQVHRNVRGLQHLIVSLAQVRHIESILLVFSHSYYSDYINRLIHSIDFCKVMQIFYPHSVQLHPDKFPGIDPEDCINGSEIATQHCRRDASLAERKHHWWWKANFIFDQMEWSGGYIANVIFLEEHQYVAPDLLHVLQYVQRSLSYFPDVEIMSFGTMYTRNLDPNLLILENWRPPFDVGVAFNKTTWNKIVELSSFYCLYDDCSWSYSLLNVFKNFPRGDVSMVACVAPRVISTTQFDDADRAVVEISRLFAKFELFPKKVKAAFLFGPNGRVYLTVQAPARGNGGWSNIKDHLLCLDPLTAAAEGYEVTTSRFDHYTD